jgi:antitoxin YefM
MQTTYRLNVNELDENFLEGLKATFKDKEIEIIVSEVDETEYLLKSPANKKRLLQAIENVNNNTNLVEVELENL